ncbi:MAG: hypothetical protein ACLFPI_12490, partial [Desulfobacterales bacterium]
MRGDMNVLCCGQMPGKNKTAVLLFGCGISRGSLFGRCIRAGHLLGTLRGVLRTRTLSCAQTSAGRLAPL